MELAESIVVLAAAPPAVRGPLAIDSYRPCFYRGGLAELKRRIEG